MPLYEFKCDACDEVFESLLSLHADKKVNCTKCGSSNTRKLMSAPGIRLASKTTTPSGCRPRGGFS